MVAERFRDGDGRFGNFEGRGVCLFLKMARAWGSKLKSEFEEVQRSSEDALNGFSQVFRLRGGETRKLTKIFEDMFVRGRGVVSGCCTKIVRLESQVTVDQKIMIPRTIEVFGRGCFSGCLIVAFAFESGSGFWEFEELCFEACFVRSICIPCSVERFGAGVLFGSIR
jgi:hypothetical protein